MIDDAILEVSGQVTDNEMVNVAEAVDDVRDVIMSVLPRLHSALVKKRCQGCIINDPSQQHHTCLEAGGLVDDRVILLEECLAMITNTTIKMIYIVNEKPVPTIDVDSVKAIASQHIIEEYQKGNIGTVASEQMVLNFYAHIEQFFASTC